MLARKHPEGAKPIGVLKSLCRIDQKTVIRPKRPAIGRGYQLAFRCFFAALASRFLAFSNLRWRAWIRRRRSFDMVGMKPSSVVLISRENRD